MQSHPRRMHPPQEHGAAIQAELEARAAAAAASHAHAAHAHSPPPAAWSLPGASWRLPAISIPTVSIPTVSISLPTASADTTIIVATILVLFVYYVFTVLNERSNASTSRQTLHDAQQSLHAAAVEGDGAAEEIACGNENAQLVGETLRRNGKHSFAELLECTVQVCSCSAPSSSPRLTSAHLIFPHL